MNIKIDTTAVEPMINALKKLKSNTLTKAELVGVLNLPAYQVEFERYNQQGMPICTIPKYEYVDYLMNCLKTKEEDVKNERLKMRHNELVEFIKNIDKFNFSSLKQIQFDENDLAEIARRLKNGMPDGVFDEMPDLTIISTVGIGNSFGYPYKNYIHYDAMRINKFIASKEELIALTAHETHHILMGKVFGKIKEVKPQDYLLVCLAFEGLAMKFCNNVVGAISKPMYADKPKNLVTDKTTWDFFAAEFVFMFDKLNTDYKKIRDEKLTIDDAEKMLSDYWVTPEVFSVVDGKKIAAAHYRSYYMGNEIFGTLYDNYGKDELYNIIEHPEMIALRFNAVSPDQYKIGE